MIADDILKEKIRLDISCELSALQFACNINPFFVWRQEKNSKCHLLKFLPGILWLVWSVTAQSTLLWSCQAGHFNYLTTLFLGRLSSLMVHLYLCTFFCQKLKTALFEPVEGNEWPQKIFHDQSPRKNVARPGGDWTCDLLITSRTCIQLSHGMLNINP